MNSLIGSLIVRDLNRQSEEKNSNKKDDITEEVDLDALITEKEEELYFCPEKGNVIFASAIDCWAFTLETFSSILSDKIGFKKEIIQKLLWGEYYYNHKNKKVYTNTNGFSNSSCKPMFVEFVLQNIYKLYEKVGTEKSISKLNTIVTQLNLKVDLKNDNDNYDPKIMIKKIMREWLPIPSTVFETVIKIIPNPLEANINKLDILFPRYKVNSITFPEVEEMKEKMKRKNADELKDGEIFAFISKMIPCAKKSILDMDFIGEEDKNDVVFMPFCRIYSGKITKGKSYFVIGPKHDVKSNFYDINQIKFDNLYIFVKQCLEPVNEVYPGNIFSIGNLHNNVFKTATIFSISGS